MKVSEIVSQAVIMKSIAPNKYYQVSKQECGSIAFHFYPTQQFSSQQEDTVFPE